MRVRLDEAVRFPESKVLVDFDNVGFASMNLWHDISSFVLDISGSREKESDTLGGISSDVFNLVVDNSTNAFSKDNANSPYYGKIKSNTRFCVQMGFKGEALDTSIVGYIKSFKPRWKAKEYVLAATCPMEKLKKAEVPKTAYQDITWDEAINLLVDAAGIDPYFVRDIPKTEYFFKYLKFDQQNCFDALKQFMQMSVGQAYFEGNRFVVNSKLALDYTLDTTAKHTVTADDPFDFEENIDEGKIINQVSVISNPKEIGNLEVVWETPDNFQKVQNEQTVYDGSGYIYIDAANRPLYWTESDEITIKNLSNGYDIEWGVYNAELGRVSVHDNSLPFLATGHRLSISYTYQFLVLLPNQTRKFVASLDSEVASLIEPDVIAWNANATARVPYSTTPNAANTVSKQTMVLKDDGQVVEFELKNNTADKVSISTLQMRGYPIKVLNPIEVYNKDVASINEFNKQEFNMQNDYVNSIGLARKISQYVIDNFSSLRKELFIQINGYSELKLNDIMQVTEPESGTNHKFTIERIDFAFNPTNGWTADLDLLEIDTEAWVYDTFGGESYNKTNTGVPDVEFIESINANMVTNGGAELHTGSGDISDMGAIDMIHRVPDYWGFVRTDGNATARVRVGGNFIIHGKKTFEISTTDAGTGYYYQIINGIVPESPYTLTFKARGNNCTGRATIEEYDVNSVLLTTHGVTIDEYKQYKISIDTNAQTSIIQLKFENYSGSFISELWFDEVKLENSAKHTPYVETEESNALQADTVYANSLTIGNQYGIEVYDQLDDIKVRLGQYEAGKYGLKVYGGAIEIVGGLSKTQIDPLSVADWDAAEDNAVNRAYADTENQINDFGWNMKSDLRMTAPLPNSITLNADGITAANPTDPTIYARLDYRGLYVANGALVIEGGLAKEKLATAVQTEINDALTNAGNAQTTANDAQTTANNANTTANNAQTTANSAKSSVDLWKYPNTTYIDGGQIYTGTVTANKINVSTLSAIVANLGYVTAGEIHLQDPNNSYNTLDIYNNQIVVGGWSNSGIQQVQMNQGNILVQGATPNGEGVESLRLAHGRVLFGNLENAYVSYRPSLARLNLVNDGGSILIKSASGYQTRLFADALFDGGTITFQSRANFTGVFDISSVSQFFGKIPNATYADSAGSVSYATSAGNADTLDNYNSNAFSFSGHVHSDTEYVKPYTGQGLKLWISPTTREFRVYVGSTLVGRMTMNA